MSEYFSASNSKIPYNDINEWGNPSCPSSQIANNALSHHQTDNPVISENLSENGCQSPSQNHLTPPSINASMNNIMDFAAQNQQTTRSSVAIHTIVEQFDPCRPSLSQLSVPDPLAPSRKNLNPSITRPPHTHQLQSKLALETVTNERNLDINSHSEQISPMEVNQSNQPSSSFENTQEEQLPKQTSSQNDFDNLDLFDTQTPSSSSTNSFRETYAIIPSNVLYIDLVRTVLVQLGYTIADMINANCK